MLVNGSQPNGSCQDSTSTLDGYPISFCTGTSVLNDGIIPGLDGVGQSNQQWASGLFTLIGTNTIRLSFELDSVGHDRMELAVLNCPEMNINLRMLSVYFDSSFRPDRVQNSDTLGNLAVEAQIMNTSCDHLLVFCVKYNPTQLPTQFINLEIPNNSSGTFVFLGEVTFLNGGNKPCDLAMPEAVKGNELSCYLTPRPGKNTNRQIVPKHHSIMHNIIIIIIRPLQLLLLFHGPN